MANFKLNEVYAKWAPLKTLIKESSTVIAPRSMVALDTGLAISATEASTSIAYSPSGAPAGVTTVQILNDRLAEFVGTADANFAVTDKWGIVDMVLTWAGQLIDIGESTTDVFKVDISEDAGVAGSANNVRVRINKFLY